MSPPKHTVCISSIKHIVLIMPCTGRCILGCHLDRCSKQVHAQELPIKNRKQPYESLSRSQLAADESQAPGPSQVRISHYVASGAD